LILFNYQDLDLILIYQPTQAPPIEPEADPLIGLFSSPPTLATDFETLLEHNLQPHSGWTWKQS
jgi:hypothetical protein